MKINTGVLIPVERDGEHVGELHLDPSDVVFAERVYDIISYFKDRQAEYEARGAALDANKETDEYGIPKNAREIMKLARDICEDVMVKIDEVFGAGVSQMVFGQSRSFDAISEFLEEVGISLEAAQNERIKKYTNRAQRRSLK
ncbi:DUF6673 family protein [Intestinibacillus massiliensis]|uniref:DUF6673 family protein n=1 Tax=Intestinibacillus massiliensis TaxID=1871029 RepID=UPI000B3549D6|nr:DUF6673 family protein [Intestinibacillus massiliensis]